MMTRQKPMTSSGNKIIREQFLRLLPYQVLLLVINSMNGIIDSMVAANLIGEQAMTAIGLYNPLNHLLYAASIMLVSGSQILYGRYMAREDTEAKNNLFSVNLAFSLIFSVILGGCMALFVRMGLTGYMVSGEAELAALNVYFLGMAPGIPGLVIGQQLFSFLSLENRTRRTMAATLVCVAVNTGADLLLVAGFGMGTLGLALASVLSFWAFCAVMAAYYLSGKSVLRLRFRALRWHAVAEMARLGYPSAISRFMEVFRCFIVNALLLKYVGSTGLSSFAASNSVMAVFWTIPFGMTAVSRMLLSISIGEEDRQTTRQTMRVDILTGLLIMCFVVAGLVLAAEPLTRLFFRDPGAPEFGMTVTAFRLLPLCMPFSVIQQHFSCYYQIMEKKVFATVIPVMNGAVNVVLFSLLLIPGTGMTGLYLANILNGVVIVLLIAAFSIAENRYLPRSLDDLMAMPAGFGISEEDTLNLAVRHMEDVSDVSRRVETFCLSKGIDSRRATLAGLALEEMAGNIVKHGFGEQSRQTGSSNPPSGTAEAPKGRSRHLADIRVSIKKGEVILRLRDDCMPFDPLKQMKQTESEPAGDTTRRILASAKDVQMNIGLRLIFGLIPSIRYDHVLGLNVLMIKI